MRPVENKIKVLIAEDVEPIQKRYCNILSKDPSICVSGCAKNGYEAVMLATLHKPDIILMDIEMEEREAGIRASREILRQFPEIRVIILTVYEEDELIFSAFQAGVCDYMIKTASPDEIINGVKDAYHNRSPIRPMIAEKIRREFRRVKSKEESFLYNIHIFLQLTHTELDILDLLARGKSRKEICDIRFVELSTVKTQIHSILKKFGKDSISDVIEQLNRFKVFETLRGMKNNSVDEF